MNSQDSTPFRLYGRRGGIPTRCPPKRWGEAETWWSAGDAAQRLQTAPSLDEACAGLGGWLMHSRDGPPNGEGAKLRGQGPRSEADAAHGLPACKSRDAGRAPPSRF
jgi:hypothetical protein